MVTSLSKWVTIILNGVVKCLNQHFKLFKKHYIILIDNLTSMARVAHEAWLMTTLSALAIYLSCDLLIHVVEVSSLYLSNYFYFTKTHYLTLSLKADKEQKNLHEWKENS